MNSSIFGFIDIILLILVALIKLLATHADSIAVRQKCQ